VGPGARAGGSRGQGTPDAGLLDRSYGDGGSATTDDVHPQITALYGSTATMQPDGKLLVVGVNNARSIALARWAPPSDLPRAER
jgi:hypothetical protein